MLFQLGRGSNYRGVPHARFHCRWFSIVQNQSSHRKTPLHSQQLCSCQVVINTTDRARVRRTVRYPLTWTLTVRQKQGRKHHCWQGSVSNYRRLAEKAYNTEQIQVSCVDLHFIETVGFDEMRRSKMEILTELTTALLMAADTGGVHVFLICVNLG
jgi:hypothetical protein